MKSSIKTMICGAGRTALLTVFIFAAGTAKAAVPELINFQGILTDTADNPITGSVPMVFKFYTAATGGSSVWDETQNVIPDSAGLYSVLLGSATAFSTYSISFSTAYWLGVTVGTDGEMLPRYKIVSSAYALYSIYSGTSSWAEGADWPGITNKPALADAYLASTQTFSGRNDLLAETYFSSNVAVGSMLAPSALNVTGSFKLINGSQAAGKILTSDSAGLGSWAPPAIAYARVTAAPAATTFPSAMADITGLTLNLAAFTAYEVEAALSCEASDDWGVQYQLGFDGAGSGLEAFIYGADTSNTVKTERLTAVNTTSALPFLNFTAQPGGILIKGVINTSAAGTLTAQHLKLNSGTSTVYAGSYLKATKMADLP